MLPVPAEHGIGVDAMLDRVTAGFSRGSEEEAAVEAAKAQGIKVAIIGRPNVGKSTLLNAPHLTTNSAIVSPIAYHHA